ncbi:MAG: hypothetical protein Q9205_003610 [Flavoplaca limonia]
MIAPLLLFSLTLGFTKASVLPRQASCVPPHCATSGKYAIYNCGLVATDVHNMLDALYPVLVQAVQDTQSATTSPAYQTFLKDPEFTATVANIFSQAAAGASIHPANVLTDGAPVIYCLNRKGQLAGTRADIGQPFDAFDACVDPNTQQATGLSASQLSGTPFITICPLFWESGLGAREWAIPSPGKCLSTNSQNEFNTDRLGRAGPLMTHRGMFVLLEEIIHLYLFPEEQKRGITTHLEVYDANKVLELSIQDAPMNAASYVLYVASKTLHDIYVPSILTRDALTS